MSPPRALRRLSLFALLSLPLLAVCALTAWAVNAFNVNDATLVGVSDPAFTSHNCLVSGRFIRPVPAFTLNTEWVIDADMVPVMANYRNQGWYMPSHTTSPVEMLPPEPTALDMGLLRVQVFRSLRLDYTADGGTRVVATTSLVACPP